MKVLTDTFLPVGLIRHPVLGVNVPRQMVRSVEVRLADGALEEAAIVPFPRDLHRGNFHSYHLGSRSQKPLNEQLEVVGRFEAVFLTEMLIEHSRNAGDDLLADNALVVALADHGHGGLLLFPGVLGGKVGFELPTPGEHGGGGAEPAAVDASVEPEIFPADNLVVLQEVEAMRVEEVSLYLVAVAEYLTWKV